MTQKLEIIRDICNECNGEGVLSRCCQVEVSDHRCSSCGRYCKTEYCGNCNGEGWHVYKLDDEVEVFVCVWSDDYLKELYKPKAVGDTKTFEGIIKEFPDNWHALVKIGRKKINVKIEDINIR